VEELGPEDCFVPAGWFRAGDREIEDNPPRRVWADAFVIRRFPVTNGEFLAFLEDLVARGQGARADAAAPIVRRYGGGVTEPRYARTADGFALGPDCPASAPVVAIDWWGAVAYADWLSARTGLPWRLASELEREKAARGVDGRRWPWGDWLDPSWCCLQDSGTDVADAAPVDSFPVDESPYGVRGCAGNVRDWCADPYDRAGPRVEDERVARVDAPGEAVYRVDRGGSWFLGPANARAADRGRGLPGNRQRDVGFRLVRSLRAG
jgi:serine/threonine-protein kinase